MSEPTRRCPTCNGLTYYVDREGAHRCEQCGGIGVVETDPPAAGGGLTEELVRLVRRYWLGV